MNVPESNSRALEQGTLSDCQVSVGHVCYVASDEIGILVAKLNDTTQTQCFEDIFRSETLNSE